jgi:RepB DNA-primase from phage plasmid
MKALWIHIFGESAGVLAVFSGERSEPGSKQLSDPRTLYFDYPRETRSAEEHCRRLCAEGREVYQCAHLLTSRRRVKASAASLTACYVDGDGAKPSTDMPQPTAVVISSPGREQYWWRLSRQVMPEEGEDLNRKLAYASGADLSGWDLTQLLRVPGTRNRKYVDAPVVELAYLSKDSYDPAEFAASLPEVHVTQESDPAWSARPKGVVGVADLSRLSESTRELVLFGDREARYTSRSEADFAACLGMFAAGFEEAEVWAAMTDPTHAISEKFLEKGRGGERYLSLTIGKAAAKARTSSRRVGRSKARRVRRRTA